ncbi:MAG TPA: RNA 3'-terminal phosphate cyclase [Thermoanaerobaculia bacterium]|jgi:RNA 3'-terminal phosphate cyclase (ATP)
MITIDGSHGEGGGQVLRTALALSLITGKPFRIENIRANRKSPGLLRQHLTAVQAATQVGDANVEGASLGAATLTFVPRALRSGDYTFSIGTAGSTMLVLQTVLLPLVLAGSPSTIELEGGTHNPSAPPFDFIERAFLPLLRTMGAAVEIELIRPGFFPAGGGRIRVRISPATRLRRLELDERGPITIRCARAVVANLPRTIAEREVDVAAEELSWPQDCREVHTLTGSVGPGNAISIIVGNERVTDVFTAFGKRGVRAEEVARAAVNQARRYIDSGAAVGEHLTDQLLLPLAVGEGGSFTTTPLSGHSQTNIETIRHFVDRDITTEQISNGIVRVAIG